MIVLQHLKKNYILISILVFGGILRFYHIDFQSVWLDEIHTLNEANPSLSWSQFYNSLLASDPHPPLYFIAIRILFSIFGYETLVLRLFSSILGIASLYAIYILGKEMINKNVGLIAAFLLSINYFHLYYSQDGRPYIFLVLFTTLSFYKLIIFIKAPNKKNAVWYGISAALMIYGHFFGLLALFTQYVILLFFFIIEKKQNRLRFFIASFISGLITLILYIPALGLLLKSMEKKTFWIAAPTLDAYTLIFKDFFGKSELVLGLTGIIIVSYFIKISKEKDFKITYKSVVENKIIFSFMLIVMWIVIVIMIPLIRSYLSVPMLISRYFIVILPAIILMLSIGIYQFQNKFSRAIILSMFLVFSMADILVVKKYYQKVIKAQFRESTNFIIDNNLDNTPVVSSLGWYMPYFLDNDKVSYKLINSPLEEYIAEMQKDSTKIKPFWYIDAFGSEYNPAKSTQNFMDKNFYIENNYDGFQAWTKHFILLKDVPKTIDFSKFEIIKKRNGDSFKFNVEKWANSNNEIKVSGWAYFDKQEASKSVIDIVLIKTGDLNALRLQTQKVIRKDVTTFFKSDFDVSNSGFSSTFNSSNLGSGKYHIAIYLRNEVTGKEGLILTKKSIEK